MSLFNLIIFPSHTFFCLFVSTWILQTVVCFKLHFYISELPQWLSRLRICLQCKGHTGDAGSIPELGRLAGVGNGKPLQYSCLENAMDRRAWWATVLGSQRIGHD